MGRARPSSGTRSSERQSAKPRTDYQTPQRMGAAQQGRKSLVQSERRMTATGSKRLSGRGSAVRRGWACVVRLSVGLGCYKGFLSCGNDVISVEVDDDQS